jgi:hypothetical protein
MSGCPHMLDDHSSGMHVATHLKQPTRAASRKMRTARRKALHAAPIWPCSRWGLPCRPRYRGRGALLPHPFTLASETLTGTQAVCFLWHFPWSRLRRTLSGTASPWSPDFPHRPPDLKQDQSSARPSSQLMSALVYNTFFRIPQLCLTPVLRLELASEKITTGQQ